MINLYHISGMHCASCATVIEKALREKLGFKEIEVNPGTETVSLAHSPHVTLHDMNRVLNPLGYSLSLTEKSADDHDHNHGLGRRGLTILIVATGAVFIQMGLKLLASVGLLPEIPFLMMIDSVIMPILATYVMLFPGRIYIRALVNFLRFRVANMDTLIGLGTMCAYLYSMFITIFGNNLSSYLDTSAMYFDVTIVVITFVQLGSYLENRAKEQTKTALSGLMKLQAKNATVIREGQQLNISVAEVVIGDHIIVKAGELIPVDGTVISGETTIDQSNLTGESVPIYTEKNGMVRAGTLNIESSITIKALGIGETTLLGKIIQAVKEAQSSKAPIQKLADRVSRIFVPLVLLIAVSGLLGWLIIGSQFLGLKTVLPLALTSFIGVLIIACPCALGLATPTALVVGVGRAARMGILIKNAEALEKLSSINVLLTDKTGTLTTGKPKLSDFYNVGDLKDDEALRIMASLESKSSHPIAHAITTEAKIKGLKLYDMHSSVIPGKGIEGTYKGVKYLVGNQQLARERHLKVDEKIIKEITSIGLTPLIFSHNNKILAYASVGDTVKENAKKAIHELQHRGIKVVMITGDHQDSAAQVSKELGIQSFHAEVLPQDKLDIVKEYQKAGVVAMVGDGINDGPALTQADVGIAMEHGSDVAIDSASITLLAGDISKIKTAYELSHQTMKIIKENLFWAFAFNAISIPLAVGLLYPITGKMLSPALAGVAMAASSVIVVSNSLRLKRVRL